MFKLVDSSERRMQDGDIVEVFPGCGDWGIAVASRITNGILAGDIELAYLSTPAFPCSYLFEHIGYTYHLLGNIHEQ